MKEIEEGIAAHLMVIHFWEDHSGQRQDCLMRILSGHLTLLDRQTTESVNILEAGKTPSRSLNLKTEWGGAKIPGILVSQPKGVSKVEEPDSRMIKEHKEEKERFVSKKGTKRIAYNGDDRRREIREEVEEQSQQRPDVCGVGKRRRSTSPPTPTKTLKPPKKASPSPKEQVDKETPSS